MEPIKVVVHGALGRMGREILPILSQSEIAQPVGAVSRNAQDDSLSLPGISRSIPLSSDLHNLLDRCNPQVIVDFTSAQGALVAAKSGIPRGINLVIGSTGLEPAHVQEIEDLCQRHRVAAVIAPNYAVGAILLMHMAKQAGRFFSYANIIEEHHEAKKDVPSGTALALARAVAQGREEPFQRPSPDKESLEALHLPRAPFQRPSPEKESLPGTRGGELEGVSIHSMRMPGRMAHHEVILAAQGQTLSLRHDTINRGCYVPGVIVAIKYVVQSEGLTIGLEHILGLE